jgi:hypothetical protein
MRRSRIVQGIDRTLWGLYAAVYLLGLGLTLWFLIFCGLKP